MRRLEGGDLVLVAERDRDVVEPLEQAPALELVDLEREGAGGLLLEVDRQLCARAGGHELSYLLVGERHRQQADLPGVRAEDVAERRRDDDLEAVVLERPGGVLARGAAAEVPARDEDRGARGVGAVELEVGVLDPVEEEKLAEAGATDALEELLRDDLVGVDVGT